MQIDSIEVFHAALPLRRAQPTPNGPCDKLETVLVGMRCGEAVGWGEASPGNAPSSGAEWAAGVFGCIRDWLAPALVGRMVDSGDALHERLAAFQKAFEWGERIPIGLLYEEERPTHEDGFPALRAGALFKRDLRPTPEGFEALKAEFL